MSYYKNNQNKLFWLEAQDDPSVWLSDDCLLITDEEASSIRALNSLDNQSIVPLVITMRQARLVLHNAGLLQAVNADVATMSAEAQIEWEFASTVQRSSPLVATLAVALGLDNAALDNMFVTASAL